MSSRRNQAGFSIVELLVVMAIIGVLIGMLLPAVERAREVANRVRCESHLHQLGCALHGFQAVHRHFPSDHSYAWFNPVPRPPAPSVPPRNDSSVQERYPAYATFYMDIVPFLEGLDAELPDPGDYLWTATPKPVSLFLCPTRRQVDVPTTNTADYAHAMDPHASSNGNFPWTATSAAGPIGGHPAEPAWQKVHAVMGAGIYRDEVRLADVAGKDGSSNTLLLAHKGVRPAFAGTEYHWQYPTPFATVRYPGSFLRDRAVVSSLDKLHMSTPHAVMPCLFTDGSVRGIGCGALSNRDMGYLWGFNDGQALVLP